eukprot:g7576.t1
MDPGSIVPFLAAFVAAPIGGIFDYPIRRVVHIRQAQGAMPGFEYRNVISCLRQMPGEQGGIKHVWRGLTPWFLASWAKKPLAMLAKEQVRSVGLFRTSQNMHVSEIMVKNVAAGAISGGLVLFVLHPLQMASLRLQLDLGGGTLGPRAPFQNGRQVLSQIAKQSGVFSAPFSSNGGIYRGVSGMGAHALVKYGLFFGIYDTAKTWVNSSLFAKFLLGFGVTNLAAFFSYPILTGTVRAQAAVSPIASFKGTVMPVQYRGTLHAMVAVAKAEGVGALWRGFGLTLGRSIFGAIFLVGYDTMR